MNQFISDITANLDITEKQPAKKQPEGIAGAETGSPRWSVSQIQALLDLP
ncbi:hypothetical protein SAMN05216420_1191, partial [Nitrosospira sp. Nl5]